MKRPPHEPFDDNRHQPYGQVHDWAWADWGDYWFRSEPSEWLSGWQLKHDTYARYAVRHQIASQDGTLPAEPARLEEAAFREHRRKLYDLLTVKPVTDKVRLKIAQATDLLLLHPFQTYTFTDYERMYAEARRLGCRELPPQVTREEFLKHKRELCALWRASCSGKYGTIQERREDQLATLLFPPRLI